MAIVTRVAQGLVDVDAEVKKLNKQLKGVVTSLENLEKQMAMPGYETKVPEKVRAKNTEKVRGKAGSAPPTRARRLTRRPSGVGATLSPQLEDLMFKLANITGAIESMEAMRE